MTPALTSPAPTDIDALASGLRAVIRDAGEIALGFARDGAKRWRKGDQSLVTEADITVDRFLRERLEGLAPEAGWLSEETADTPERLARERVWIVDPIDGTRAFIEGVPVWVISVALVEAGRPVLGAILNPSTEEYFEARLGGGATLDDRPIRARQTDGMAGASVIGPRVIMDALAGTGLVAGPWIYALAYRLVGAAAGRYDAAIASGRAKDWDIAAADLILGEAGARLVGMDGRVPTYNRPDPRHCPLVGATEPLNGGLRAALVRAAAQGAPTWT